MNFSRNKVWIVPLLALVSYPLWQPPVAGFLAPRQSTVVLQEQKSRDDDRVLHLYKVSMSQSTGDTLEIELAADSVATGDSDSSDYHFSGVDCRIYDEFGKATEVSGGEALYATDKKLITIVDDVIVISSDGTHRLSTDALRYFTHYKVAKTATPVHITSQDFEVFGNSMMYNLRTGVFRVGGNVVFEM